MHHVHDLLSTPAATLPACRSPSQPGQVRRSSGPCMRCTRAQDGSSAASTPRRTHGYLPSSSIAASVLTVANVLWLRPSVCLSECLCTRVTDESRSHQLHDLRSRPAVAFQVADHSLLAHHVHRIYAKFTTREADITVSPVPSTPPSKTTEMPPPNLNMFNGVHFRSLSVTYTV